MNFRSVFHIFVFLWTLNLSEGFFANQFSQFVGPKDYTHADITEIGILKAVAEYFESTPATPGGSTLGVGSLTGIQNITAKKLFDKYYAGTRSAKRFQEAINQIIRYNNKVDLDHYDEAAWHFNGEQIAEANKKLIDIRGNLLKELAKSQPNYESARELIGQFFHIMQMFYSNTNFIEDISHHKYPAIGLTGITSLKTAGASMDTCKSCPPPGHPCIFNILPTLKTVLTSGYKGGQDIKKPFKDPNTTKEGKCSHGGPTDPDTFTSAATGGINKDSTHPAYSPHFYQHNLAAKAAIDHTKYFFQDATTGLLSLIKEDKYKELLKINPSHSLVFVIDQSGSMAAELPIIAQESKAIIQNASASSNAPENYILVTFSDPGTSTLVKDTTKSAVLISWIGAIQATGGNDCPEFSLTGIEAAANAAHPDSTLYVFTDSTPKDPYKQEKIDSLIASKRLRIFFIVMGTCSPTNQNGLKFSANLNHAIGRKRRDVEDDNTLIDENNANQTNAVLLLKRHIAADESPMVEVPVDKTLQEIQIDIQGDTAMPYPVIRKPNKEFLNIDGNEVFETRYQDNMVSITIRNPAPGIWGVFRFDKTTWNIEVTGQSMLDFEYRILKDREMPHSQESRIVEVEIKRGGQDVMMYNLVIGNTLGDTLHKIGLIRVNGSNRNLYECQLEHYQDDYVFGIEGLDSDGNMFQRFHKSISHVIKERSTKRQEPLRHKRSTTTWDLIDVYRHLASLSGGHVFQTTKDQIPNVFGILQSSLSGAEVLLLQNVYPGGPSSPKSFEIAVDASISQFTLNIHGKQDIPHFVLKDAIGNVNQIDNKTITMYNIGTTYLSIVVKNPKPGNWTVRKNDISEWDVEVTARSTLDFTAKQMKNDPKRFSFHEISGRLIPEENVSLVIEVNDKTAIKDLTDVSLLDIYGDEIAHYYLKKKDSFSNKGFFTTSIIVPHETFKLAVIGTTPTGGPFIRMHRDVIEPVNIKLDHIPEKVPLYINENLNVSFAVKNVGSQDENVTVTIEDDKHFAISPQFRIFHLKAWSNQTSYFTVHGGQTKGETTTITLTAKPVSPSSNNTKFHNIITYLTVEKRKIDKIPPVCNVTSSSVSCGSDPCKCTQTNVYITANIWDEGDGLDEITAPNTPTNSLLLFGFHKGLVKAVGIARATLMVNCCRKNVTIDVKDLKNLTGSCDIPVDPTYNINACTTTTPSTTTVTTTPTSTTMTSTSTSTTTSSSSTLSTTPTSTSSTKITVSSAMSSSTTSSAVSSSTTPSPSSTSAKTSSTITTSTNSTTPKKSSSTSTKSSTNVSKTSTKVSSSLSARASLSTTQRISTAKKKFSTNPTAKKEDNSSTLSDGVSYAIVAVVGAVTVSVIIGGIFIATKKMSAVSPKKTENTP